MYSAKVSVWGRYPGLAPRCAALLLCLSACNAAWTTDLQVRVLQQDGKPLRGAVVTVHVIAASAAAPAPIKAVMDQLDLAFVPDLMVIPAGSTVNFTNSDKVSHEVYSFSAAHSFKLGLYRGNGHRPELFDHPGLVTLGCNIHDAMLAYILVTDAPYYGTTAADGSWAQADIARGKYRIEVWSPRLAAAGQMLQQEITVSPGEHAQAEIRADRALRPAQLQTHPHSWDAY
jgi:plastocyanin